MTDPTSSGSPDLSRAEDVLEYLANTPFASTHVEALSGGNANFIFRLHLQDPSATPSAAKTAVLKHAKGWSASDKSFPLTVERQNIEAIALKHVHAFLSANSLATVPEVYYHDTRAHVLIMEDAGPNARNLKDLLRKSPLSESASRDLGAALGRFLAALHVRGSADVELLNAVRKNDFGRQITSWITYGRLVDTIKSSCQDTKLVEPLLTEAEVPTEAEMAEIGALANSTIKKIYEAESTFTMGDFWTGNVVVRLSDSGAIERIFVVDWEVTKPGLAYLDFAQLAAEMHTLKRFHPEASFSVDAALRAYSEAYKQEMQIDETFVRAAASHLGAHMVVITPSVQDWGSNNVMRRVVAEGIQYVLGGLCGDEEWLKASAVSGLLHGMVL